MKLDLIKVQFFAHDSTVKAVQMDTAVAVHSVKNAGEMKVWLDAQGYEWVAGTRAVWAREARG